MKKITQLIKDEQGATAVEYGLIVAAIAAVIILVVIAIGGKVETAFEKTEKPAYLTNFSVDVRLPHGTCGDRQAAVERVADHCIIHETLHHLKEVQIRIHDRNDLAA